MKARQLLRSYCMTENASAPVTASSSPDTTEDAGASDGSGVAAIESPEIIGVRLSRHEQMVQGTCVYLYCVEPWCHDPFVSNDHCGDLTRKWWVH